MPLSGRSVDFLFVILIHLGFIGHRNERSNSLQSNELIHHSKSSNEDGTVNYGAQHSPPFANNTGYASSTYGQQLDYSSPRSPSSTSTPMTMRNMTNRPNGSFITNGTNLPTLEANGQYSLSKSETQQDNSPSRVDGGKGNTNNNYMGYGSGNLYPASHRL
jgi:hypothetical protein